MHTCICIHTYIITYTYVHRTIHTDVCMDAIYIPFMMSLVTTNEQIAVPNIPFIPKQIWLPHCRHISQYSASVGYYTSACIYI